MNKMYTPKEVGILLKNQNIKNMKKKAKKDLERLTKEEAIGCVKHTSVYPTDFETKNYAGITYKMFDTCDSDDGDEWEEIYLGAIFFRKGTEKLKYLDPLRVLIGPQGTSNVEFSIEYPTDSELKLTGSLIHKDKILKPIGLCANLEKDRDFRKIA